METTKQIRITEKLDRQLAGQSTGAPLFLTMQEEKEQKQKIVVFDEINVIYAKIVKLTSILAQAIHTIQT